MFVKYHIMTDPKMPLIQHGQWCVPVEYKEQKEQELKEMIRMGIIIPQEDATLWVGSDTYPE